MCEGEWCCVVRAGGVRMIDVMEYVMQVKRGRAGMIYKIMRCGSRGGVHQ